MVMRRDYSYWGLDWLQLEPCCLLKFYPELQSCAATRDTEARERASQAGPRSTRRSCFSTWMNLEGHMQETPCSRGAVRVWQPCP